jgi:hypothetical protein
MKSTIAIPAVMSAYKGHQSIVHQLAIPKPAGHRRDREEQNRRYDRTEHKGIHAGQILPFTYP